MSPPDYTSVRQYRIALDTAGLEISRLREQLSAVTVRTKALTVRNDSLERESAHLRILAHKGGCPYGHGNPTSGCELGYPGCACMDDHLAMMMWSAEDEEKTAVRLGKRLAAALSRAEAAEANVERALGLSEDYLLRARTVEAEPHRLRGLGEDGAALERAVSAYITAHLDWTTKRRWERGSLTDGVRYAMRAALSAWRSASSGEGEKP